MWTLSEDWWKHLRLAARSFHMHPVHASVAVVAFDEAPHNRHPADMSDHAYAAYAAAEPYFRLVRGALGELVDGEHFFDVVDEHTIYEVLYDLGGWPRVVRGREALMAQFLGYVQAVELHAADHLAVHRTDSGQAMVIEYEVRGTILQNRAAYENRFCSVIRIEKRKIGHWRDYMDSLAAWNAFRS